MAGDNDQQEIVLGNKQLLSIFFVVVAMMGIAFTVGYMVGRGGGSGAAGGVSGGRQPVVTLPPPSEAVQPPAHDVTPSERPKVEAPVPDQPGPLTPSTVVQPPVADKEARPAKAEKTAEAPPEQAADSTPAASLGPYLQVAALKRPDADHVVKVLRERGFAALLGESPKVGFFRVLVGPFKDTPSLADSKAKLRAAGFDPIIAR